MPPAIHAIFTIDLLAIHTANFVLQDAMGRLQPNASAGETSCSPTSVLFPETTDAASWDGASQFTELWDVQGGVVPSLATKWCLEPHEIQIANLGPGTKEAKGIYASTSRLVLSPSEVPKTVVILPKRIKSCMKKPIGQTGGTSSSSDKSPPTVYRPPGPVKLVRFCLRKKKLLKYEKSKIVCTPDELKELWWTRKELKDIITKDAVASRCLLLRRKEYGEAIKRVLVECFNAVEISPGCKGDHNLSYTEALEIVVDNEHRGIEQSIMGCIDSGPTKQCHKIGKKCIASVLEAQKRYTNARFNDRETKQELIASQEHKYSKIAAKWAQVLAEGDAIVAQRILSNDRKPFSAVRRRTEEFDRITDPLPVNGYMDAVDNLGRLTI